MPSMWWEGAESGMHRVSVACAGIGTDMHELCSCYAPGLLEGKEDNRLSGWVRMRVSFGCVRRRSNKNWAITMFLYVSLCFSMSRCICNSSDVDQLCVRLGANGASRSLAPR